MSFAFKTSCFETVGDSCCHPHKVDGARETRWADNHVSG